MTDEKKSPAPVAAPDFGEIQIAGGAAAHRPRVRSAAAKPPQAAAPPPEKKFARQKKNPRSDGRGRLCLVLLLLLPPALLLLWLAGAFYLLPWYVQGPLTEKISSQLGRQVTVGQVSLAPFKLILRLNEITVGPAVGRLDEPELARIAAAEARIRPAALLKGRLALEDVSVDRLRASLIRRSDGSINALPPGGLFSGLSLLPSWLDLRDLRLHRSTVHFFDQPSGKKHLVEHIEFVLPAAGQGLDPSLSAVVNSSPLQLIGQRQEDGGGPETRLTLKLDNLDPQQYLSLLPELAQKISLSAARADAVLEISLREKGSSGAGLNATGSVTFSDLLAQSADHDERPEQAFRLTSPTAHVIVRANPLQRQYAVEELLLEAPQLDLPPSMAGLLDGAELAAKAAALLNPAATSLAAGKLTVNRGLVRSGGQEWTDVQLELADFKNLAAAAEEKDAAARLSFSARSGKSSLLFSGAADPAFNLNGSLVLENMRADWLRSFLSAAEGLRFSKGGADIAGALRLEQRAEGGPLLTVSDSVLTLRDFSLQQKKAALLTAKSLRGSGCVLDGAAGSMSCGKASLDGADFADTAFFLSGGKKSGLHFSCGALELTNSSARLPFGPASLPLSGLNLHMQADSSLKLTAAAGKQGSIEISGAAAKSKDGALLLSGKLNLKNAAADLLHPYLSKGGELRFKQGGADLSGSFTLNGPALSLADGAVTLRNFALQRGEAVLLSGKAASGSDCSLDGAAKRMSCGKITLDGADFADSGFFLRPAGSLRLSVKTLELKDSSAKLPLGGAELPLSSLKMSLSGLNGKQPGQISLEAASGSGRLEISGAAAKEESGLALSGTLNLRNAGVDILQPCLGDGISFSKGGGADISGAFKTSGAALTLSDGAVTVRDFSLQRGGAALLSGRAASGADCSIDGAAGGMSCGKIILDGTDFADSGFFLRPAGRFRLSANTLELKDSSVKLALSGTQLPLSGLKMSVGSLPGPISLEAAAGSGRLELSGEAAKSEAGLALSGQLHLRGVSAEMLQRSLGDGISVAKGSTDISGGCRLSPAEGGFHLSLSNGAVTVRDFSLQRGGAALLSGRTASGSDCSLDGAAGGMSCGKIILDGADFADSGFFLRPAGRFRLSANTLELKDSAAQLTLGGTSLPLSGLKMSIGSLPGPVSLDAALGSGKLAVSGEAEKTESGLRLGGSVLLRNADASLLNPYLGDELRFSRGRAELSGAGRLNAGADGAALHLAGGAVTVQDFALQRGGAALLSGKTASGSDCSIDGAAGGMSCGKIALDGADFAADAPGFFFRPADRLRIAADAVEISGSSALLPVGQAELPLSGLKMRLNGLRSPQPPQNNFHFAAAVGQGSLKADGQLRRDGSGAAELTAERIDIRLFSKAFASLFRDSLILKQGSLNAKGEFRLPENRFIGSLEMEQFAAETGKGDSLSWRRAAADKAALTLSPFAAAAARLDLEEPQLRLTSAESGLPGAFLGLFAALPQIALEQCGISGGGMRLGSRVFSGVQGSVGPVKAGAAALFAFSGTMGGGDFAVSGSAGRDGAKLDKLAVERLPLEKTAELLAKQLGLDSSRGKITRSVSAEGDRLDCSGFVPLPKSEFALTLALLTGKDGSFTLPLHGLPADAAEELLAKAAAEAVQKLRLQHMVSPWTFLDKLIPGLSKAQSIDFLPGDKVPDFMEDLNGIREVSGLRPHIGWTVKGCYDREADRKTLLAQMQKIGAEKIAEENARRKKEMDSLLAQETLRQQTLNKAGLPIIEDMLPKIKAREELQPLPAPQAELPESLLPELARVRAEVARGHLTGKLGVPAARVSIEEGGACGAKAELTPAPFW